MTIGTPEGKEGENGTEEIFEEIMTGNVPRFGTNTKSQIQKAQRMSINTNSLHLGISYSSYKKKKRKEKKNRSKRKQRNHSSRWLWEEYYLLRNKMRIIADFYKKPQE